MNGSVSLLGSDVAGGEPPIRCEEIMLSLLGTASPSALREWYSKLAKSGVVVDPLSYAGILCLTP